VPLGGGADLGAVLSARVSGFIGLRCVSCGRAFEPDEILYVCPGCGPVGGTLDVLYDLAWARERFTPAILRGRREICGGVTRYREILPIRREGAFPDIPVGMTPLYRPPERLGLAPNVWIKDDTRHPSGSAKDRASVVAVARARELGASVIAAASTGNAASSIATLAAHAGLGCVIFAPAAAPEAKLVQIRMHGAMLLAVDGTYDQAFDLCREVASRTGWFNRNTATNPVLGEGKKTIALEIWEQLGYRAPGAVLVPVGDGCVIGGVAKGFEDLRDLGLIPKVPRLIGVQAEGSAALANAWRAGEDRCAPVAASTVADSISVSVPRDQVKALRAVRRSAGAFVTVSDGAILQAMVELASRAGIYAEPAAAAPLAGLRKALADGSVDPGEEVVLVVTGHGLKDLAAARRAAESNPPIPIGADPAAPEAVARSVEDAWSRFSKQR
jgi:threonine synthase